MEGRVGKGLITAFLCLVILSALFFALLESTKNLKAQSGANGDSPLLIEVVDPWTFTGVMADYEYDLYRMGPDGLEYVAPPDFVYEEAFSLETPVLRELGVATDEINPASRETTIALDISDNQILIDDPFVVMYTITPATKTVILQGGAATAEVQILPAAVDAYVAVRNPTGNLVFVDRFSGLRKKFYFSPVPFAANNPIARFFGIVGIFHFDSRNVYGNYKIYAVMVPPGANVFDERNWISNLATAEFSLGIVAP